MDHGEHAALLRLRELILRGTLAPGERLLEERLAAELDLSRTPIRQALPALALEGLLVRVGRRGYAVRRFTREESVAALHVRAVLEGHAARSVTLADRGPELASALQPALDEGDALLAAGLPIEEMEDGYGRMNARFHGAIVEGARELLLRDLVARCNVVPFVAPGAVAFDGRDRQRVLTMLGYAHHQHHAVVDALRANDGARVEMLLREHATTQEGSITRPATDGDGPPPAT